MITPCFSSPLRLTRGVSLQDAPANYIISLQFIEFGCTSSRPLTALIHYLAQFKDFHCTAHLFGNTDPDSGIGAFEFLRFLPPLSELSPLSLSHLDTPSSASLRLSLHIAQANDGSVAQIINFVAHFALSATPLDFTHQ
jgi:hypothetical protein